MPNNNRNIVVIGTSAGGLEALDSVVAQLPPDLPASFFVVQHLAPDMIGSALLSRLQRHLSFHCKFAEDGETFYPGHIYVAPPDRHLLVKEQTLIVRKGAFENRHRPAIDSLFRSAAIAHGPRVIGVILTGMLDDGTAGLLAVKQCGGIAIVQSPSGAAYPSMPRSALANVAVDYCASIEEIGGLLETLIRENVETRKPPPKIVKKEAEIAERVLTDVKESENLGTLFPHTCPDCGGSLWKVGDDNLPHFRCFTGHTFSLPALIEAQSEKIEETLWVVLRMLEERKNLLRTVNGSHAAERAEEAQTHIDRIRAILLSSKLRNDAAS
jgi:two-component system chemotaxis response regulator CheB